MDRQHVRLRDMDILAQFVELVLRRHQPVKDLVRQRHHIGMRHPRAIMPVRSFALLVGTHLGERHLIGFRTPLDRDLRRHAAHRESLAAMAGPDQQQRIGGQKIRRHRHHAAIRRHKGRVAAETLDERENIIPTPAIQADNMILQLIQDLVHFKRRRQRLDQDRRLEHAMRNPKRFLCMAEHRVPQSCFFMAFHFRQIKPRRRPLRDNRLRIMKYIKPEIEQTARHRFAIHRHMRFRQMPTARADQQCRWLRRNRVGFSGFLVGEIQRPRPAVPHIELAFDHIRPGRRGGILEIGHKHFCARIQRIDDHLAVNRAGDLNPAIQQIGRNRRNRPIAFADMLGLGKEIGQFAGIKALLAHHARLEQCLACRIETLMQIDQKSECRRRQYFLVTRPRLAMNLCTAHQTIPSIRRGHHRTRQPATD